MTKTTVTTREYDQDGRVVKETVTETDYRTPNTWRDGTYPYRFPRYPHVYPYVTYTPTTSPLKGINVC